MKNAFQDILDDSEKTKKINLDKLKFMIKN